MEQPAALFLFDYSTVMAQPWAEAGYQCYCVDIKHPAGETVEGNIVKVGADIEYWMPPRRDWQFACAFTPCTDVAVSGARWFKAKGLRTLSKAIALFARSEEILTALEVRGFIENPVSTLASYWRKPDYLFDPCDYGDPYTKKTCLWAFHGFVMPEKNRVEPTEGSKMHLLPPSTDRAEQRSETPPGFAKAVFEFNAKQKGLNHE